jgi:hypothetical protein
LFAFVDGGGGTMFAASDGADELVTVPVVVGGGGTTLLGSAGAFPEALFALTDGGGGTTSLAPKMRPMMLPMKDPLEGCEGGGGTTLRAPALRRRISCETSVEGGGTTTDGGGRVSFAFRELARSGAETGGGTTSECVICMGPRKGSRGNAAGAGGMTEVESSGAERP